MRINKAFIFLLLIISFFILLGCIEDDNFDTQPHPDEYITEISRYCEKDSDCIFICGLGYLNKNSIISQKTIDSLNGLECAMSGPPICVNNKCVDEWNVYE